MNQRDLVYISALFLLFGSFLFPSVTVTTEDRNSRVQSKLEVNRSWWVQLLPNLGNPPKTSHKEVDFSVTLAQKPTGVKLKIYIFKHFKHLLCRGQRASCCGSLSHCSCGTGYQPVALIPFCIRLQKGLFHPALGWVTLQPLQPQIHRDRVSVLN